MDIRNSHLSHISKILLRSMLLTTLLAACIFFGAKKVQAAAEYPKAENIFIAGAGKMSASRLYYVNGAKSCSEKADNWNLRYDPKTGTLMMRDYNGFQIEVKDSKNCELTIDLKGKNQLTKADRFGILAEGVQLVITSQGDGVLSISGNDEGNMPGGAICNERTSSDDVRDIILKGSAKLFVDVYGKYGVTGIRASGAISIEDNAEADVRVKEGPHALGAFFALQSESVNIATKGRVNIDAAVRENMSLKAYPLSTDKLTVKPGCAYVSFGTVMKYPRIDYNGKIAGQAVNGYTTVYKTTEYTAGLLLAPNNADPAPAVCSALFPDPSFLTYVSDLFDKDHDGILSEKEISGAKEIVCHNLAAYKGYMDAASLVGTEYLSALESLVWDGGALTTLDLNGCTKLQTVNVKENKIESLKAGMLKNLKELTANGNGMKMLDLGAHPDLTALYAQGNALVRVPLSGSPILLNAYQKGKKTEEGNAVRYEDGSGILVIDKNTPVQEEPVPVESIALDRSSIEIPAGTTAALNVEYKPDDATELAFTWKSTAPDIAEADAGGLVFAKKMGKTKVTVTAPGGKKAECSVRVLFSDVTNKKLAAYDAVYWGTDHKIVYGYDSYFDIDANCTRGQVVLFLWRAAGKPEPSSTEITFKDKADIEKLAPSYAKAILWANEKKIALGYTSGANKGCFKPNDPCTRGQIVTFLWRYAGSPAPKSGTKDFPDVKKSHVYYNAIMWAAGQKITTGFSDGTFRPDDKCTRGQCVTFIYRHLK